MTPGRYAVLAGVGTVVWLGWTIGGFAVADLVGRAVGWPGAVAVVGVVIAVAIGVPVYLMCRGLER